MTITAKVIADSIGHRGTRITTFSLRYPRFIHSELMTHRVFSRNSSSSRAIPIQKMIDNIIKDPAMPVFWGKNQAGMQSREELSPANIEMCKGIWLAAMYGTINNVKLLMDNGLHKQIANRPLEPWMHSETVITSTYWGNWYNLRHHTDAQPEIKILSMEMLKAHNASTPKQLKAGEWHLPFISEDEVDMPNDFKLVCSTARCARVSYMNHEGKKTTFDEDLRTFNKLVGGNPKHASPSEHQAKYPETHDLQDNYILPHLTGNFQNWVQHRKLIKGENMPVFEDLV